MYYVRGQVFNLAHCAYHATIDQTYLKGESVPLPTLVKQLVDKKLSAYCQKKFPVDIRDQLRLIYKFRGNTVTLFESRPAFAKPDLWVEIPVAQFRYDHDKNIWSLYCADRNSKWHPDTVIEPEKDFNRLLDEIDRDPTGTYWG